MSAAAHFIGKQTIYFFHSSGCSDKAGRIRSQDAHQCPLSQDFLHLLFNFFVNLIKHLKPSSIDSAFSCRDFFDGFAVQCERKFIKPNVLCQMPADFLPKSAEVRFQFAIAPHMVIGIVPCIGHGKNSSHTERTSHCLRHKENEILRAESMCAFGHLTDKILCTIGIGALHCPNHQCRFSLPTIDPKNNLVQMHVVHIHDHREQSFFTLSRLEFKIGTPFYIIFGRSPNLMDTVKTETNKPIGIQLLFQECIMRLN